MKGTEDDGDVKIMSTQGVSNLSQVSASERAAPANQRHTNDIMEARTGMKVTKAISADRDILSNKFMSMILPINLHQTHVIFLMVCISPFLRLPIRCAKNNSKA